MSAVPATHAARIERRAGPVLVHRLSTRMWLTRSVYAGSVVFVPPLGMVWALQCAWESGVNALELALLGVMYTATQLGITLGYHRHLSHRAFDPHPWLEVALLVFASMAGQGPPIHWAADHRRHHEFADELGDPHSPHGMEPNRRGGWARFWHAHVGWTFTNALTNTLYYCRDLQRSRRVRFVQRHYLLWLLSGLALPAALGFAVRGDSSGLESGLLWGGFVRLTLGHHGTMAINSLAHLVGARPFATRDQSRNLGWLAICTFGEGWHNNHHAFPSSATFALSKAEIDLGGWVLRVFAAVGLASNLKRPSARALAALRGCASVEREDAEDR